jgi:ferredoxin
MVKVRFSTADIEIEVAEGTELLHLYQRYPFLPLKFGCRQGECGTCLIDIVSGAHHLTPCSSEEASTLYKKKAMPTGRLACQCAFTGDITIR